MVRGVYDDLVELLNWLDHNYAGETNSERVDAFIKQVGLNNTMKRYRQDIADLMFNSKFPHDEGGE
jgi:hypothetical protein